MKKILLSGLLAAVFGFSVSANDCATAIPLAISCGGSATVSGSTVGGTPPAISTCTTSPGSGGAVWYTIVGDGSTWTASTVNAGSNYDTKIWVFSGSCGALNCVTGNDDYSGVLSFVSFSTTPGVTYYVIVGGYSSNEGNYEMTVANTNLACGTDCGNSIMVSNTSCGGFSTYTGSTVGGTPSGQGTCGTTAGTGGVIWHSFTGDGTAWTLSTDNPGTNFDTKLWLFEGSCASGSGTAVINQPSNTTCMATFSQGDLAQSFVATTNTTCGAGIQLTANGAGSGNVTIALYDNLPNAGGNMLASGTVAATDGTWADVNWASTAITTGNTYYLVFTSTNTSMCVGGDTGNPYSGGMVFANTGYGAFSTYDYTFRVFDACSGGGLVCVTGDDNGGTGTTSEITFTSTLGTNYYLVVGGNGAAEGNYELTISNVGSDVVDPVPSVASLPDVTVACEYTGTTPPTANDNCAGLISGVPDVAMPISTQGTTVVTWTYDDGNGNVITQAQNIIVADMLAPVPPAGGIGSADVDQSANNTCMATFSQTDVAQSFVATSSPICGAGIQLTSNGAGSGDVTIALYDNLPNAGGSMLASGTATATDGTWAEVTWGSMTLTAGNTYYLVFTSTNGSQCIAGSTANPYAGGMVFANSGYGAFSSYDYTFRTYTGCSSPLADINDVCEVTLPAPVATDNCAGTVTGVPDVTFPYNVQGSTVITWTFDDGNGNVTTLTQNVTLTDVTAPVPDLASLPAYTGCGVGDPVPPTATDDCLGTINGVPDVPMPILAMGTTTVTWTYTDNAGNNVSQSQVITVVPFDASVVVMGTTLMANASGATYQWVDCDNNYAPIAGATSQSYTPTAVSGNYAVIVSMNGCTDTSACFLVDYSGISELSGASVNVYPNPSTGEFHVNLKGFNGAVSQLRVTDVTGRIIRAERIVSANDEISLIVDLSADENGVYFLQLVADDTVVHFERIVKQ